MSRKPARLYATLGVLAAALGLAACFPVRFEAGMSIPPPLVAQMPATIAVYVPPEFSQFTQKEKRWSMKWEIGLGKAQTEGVMRLLNSMFERVLVVDSVEAGTRTGQKIDAILEPAIEEYAFVTPRDAGSSFFAVTVKYRMSVYTPEGRLADSWAFTGYGSAPSAGMSDKDSMQRATALALRDAGAKLAVEFRDQEIVRELLPTPDTLAPASQPNTASPAAAPEVSVQPAAPTSTNEQAPGAEPSQVPAEPASQSDAAEEPGESSSAGELPVVEEPATRTEEQRETEAPAPTT